MFPIDKYRVAEIEQIDDVKISPLRYSRNRRQGPLRSFFMIPLTTPRLPYAEGMAHLAWLFSQTGPLNIFEIQNPYPQITSNAGLTLNNGASKGVSQCVVKGLSGATTGAIRAGDFIRFAGHAKVYMINEDANSSGAGVGTIRFTPKLQQAVTQNTQVFYGEDVVFQVCLQNPVSASVNANESNYIVIDMELVEQG